MYATLEDVIELNSDFWFILFSQFFPSEEFELTDNTVWAHMKTNGKLFLKPLIYLTANS